MATFSFEDAQDTGSFSFEDAQIPETFSFEEGLDTPTRTFGGTAKDVGISAYKGMLGLQNSLVGLADIVVPGNMGGWVSSGVEAATGLTSEEADKQMSAKYSPAQQAANQAVDNAEGFLGKAGAMVQHPSTIGHALIESAPSMVAGGAAGRGLMVAGKVPGLLASAAGEGLIAAGSAQEQIRQESPTDDTTPLQTGAAILSGMGTGAVNLASGGLASKVGLGDIDTMLATGVRDVVGKGGAKAVAGRVAGGAVTEGVEETLQSGQERIWQNAALGKPLMEGVPEAAGQGLVTGAAMGMGANVAVRPSHLPSENILSAESVDQVVAEFEADSISAEPEVTTQPTGALARVPELYRGMYREAGLRYGVDPNLLAAQGWAESNFNPDAVSSAGAQGIAQFMPGTAAEYGIDPMNPIEAIDGQARYMARMLERYGGDVSKALAAYNAGPGRVDDGSWQNINETQNYVGKILGELGQESGPMSAEWAAQTEAAQAYNQQRNQPQLDESIQFAPLEEEAQLAEAPQVESVAPPIEEDVPLYAAPVSGEQIAANDPQSDLPLTDALQQRLFVPDVPLEQVKTVDNGDGSFSLIHKETGESILDGQTYVSRKEARAAFVQERNAARERQVKPSKYFNHTPKPTNIPLKDLLSSEPALDEARGARARGRDVFPTSPEHERSVRAALADNLPVPASVLAEYPELAGAKPRKDEGMADAAETDFGKIKEGEIYPTTVSGKKMYAIRGYKPRGGGDSLFGTSEEAQAEIDAFEDELELKYGGDIFSKITWHQSTSGEASPIPVAELREYNRLYAERDKIDRGDLGEFVKKVVADSGIDEKEARAGLGSIDIDEDRNTGVYATAEALRDWDKSTTGIIGKLYNHFNYPTGTGPYSKTHGEFSIGGTADRPRLAGRSYDEDLMRAPWNKEALAKAQAVYNAIARNRAMPEIDLSSIDDGQATANNGVRETEAKALPKPTRAAEPAQAEATGGEQGDSFAQEKVKKTHYIKRKQPGLGDRKVPWELVSVVSAEGVMVDNETFVVPFDQITDIRTGTPTLGRGEVIFKDGAPAKKQASQGEEKHSKAKPEGHRANVRQELESILGKLRTRKLLAGGRVTILKAQGEAQRIIGKARAQFSAAWHSSPYYFERFTTDAIGTGEGSQVFGWGLYFASKREVAEWYRKRLAGEPIKSVKIDTYDIAGGPNHIIELFDEEGSSISRSTYITTDELKNYIGAKEAANLLKEVDGNPLMLDGYYDVDFAPGTTYQVELAPNEDEYLLWDKTFDEQSEKVKAALIGDGYTPPPKPSGDHKNPWGKLLNNLLSKPETGEDIYNSYVYREADQYGNHQEKQASEHLLSLGIRGIKYLDGASRNADDGSYNYVIFDESDIEIQVKYSKDGKIQGFYLDGKAYLVEDGIAEGQAMAVLMHELGVHAKRLGFKKDAEWQGIVKSIERRSTSNGRSGQAIRAAQERIPKDTAPEHVQEELVAYLVENHAGDKIPIVDRIIAQIKKWLYQAGIMHADRLSPKDLAVFARAAVRDEARRSGKLAEGGRVADVALSRQQQAEASESRAAKTNGLPMDFDSRMARAREMGFDTDTVFSHASWTDPVIERILAKDTTFDGLFAVEGEESSHGGPHQHRFIVKTHFDHADLSRSFRNNDAPFKEVVKRELGEEPGTNEDWSLLEDLVLENESVHELWSDEDSVPTFFKEALGGYISGDLLADISWNIQKLRGKVAKEYGADAIDMTDEHGTSVLLLPGSGVRSLKAAFDPSYVESDQLLRSMAESLGVTPEQLQREYDAVVKRYQGTVRWLKAPNGKKSNLNERQWVLARTPRFKEWFGDWENDPDNASKVVDDNGEPLVVYHGSPSPEFSEFNLDKSGSNLDSGWLGKGIYFTDTAATADYHSQTGRASRPGVYPVFLNIKNPFEWGKKTKGIRGLVMNGEQLPLNLTEKISEKTGFKFDQDAEPDWGAEKKLSRALTDELSSRGFDGVVASVRGQQEFVAFSPTQIKSAMSNTGAFDASNPDIRYSVTPKEAEQAEKDFSQDLKDIYEQAPKKFDIRAATPLIKTAEYTLSKIAAGRRALEAVSRRQERKFMLQAQLLDGATDGMNAAERQVAKDTGFTKTFQQLKKQAPRSYVKVQQYLLGVDRTGRGFYLSHKYGYVVTTPGGELVGLAKTREEALTKARDHVRDNGLKGKVLIKDYGTDKGFIWTTHKPNKGKIGTFTNEQEAVAAMIKGEQAELRQRGFTEQEAAAVQSFREMTNRAFDQHAAGAREVIRRCEEEGIDPPMVEGIDETRRWAVRGKSGKNIATFESREKAEDMIRQLLVTHPRYANADIVRQTDNEIKKMFSLHDAIAQMGDMRGTYFPRQREHGGMGLRAINEQTGEKIFLKGDLYIANLDPEAKQGVLAQKADALRKLFNSGTPLGREARKLRRQGFVISFERDTTMPEDVFSAKQLSTNIAALMDEAMQRVDKSSMTPAEVAAYVSIHRAVTDQLAGIIKQRGFLSSRMKRSENYWQGFEEDPLKAGTAYANGLASGVAKRQLAQDLTMIIAGRDITWKQWKGDNPSGDWPEYTEFVNERKIDPVKQKNIYGETMSWAQEVLRNQEAADRIIGTLKGLAVLKYLAFRIPSALVNLSNMALGVPATISSHTGLSIARSSAQINRSLKTLVDYKRGTASALDTQILTEISERGWDSPQFNHDAAAVLRSRLGNAWQGVVDAGMWLFGQAEVVNRRATIHAAYKMWSRANPELTHEELMQKAHHASDRAHGWYGQETAPKWTRGAANPLKAVWTFQKFGQNYLLNIGEMIGKGDYKQAAYMLLAPVVLGGPKATLVTPVLVALAKGLGVGGEDPEEELYAWARDTFGTDAWMRFGAPGLLGVSFQGSLAMGIPVVSDVLDKGKRLNSLAELFGAPGSVVYDVYAAGENLAKGEYARAAEKALPSAFGSAFKAIRESTEGVTTENYGSVYYGADPLKVSGVDTYLRALSFAPADITGKRQQQWSERKIKDKYDEKRADINREIKRIFLQKGNTLPPEEFAKILPKIDRYNDAVAGLNRPDISFITGKSILAMLKRNARASKFERMRAMEMYEEAGE